ncbi:DUF4158 domain-containing protein [Nocardia barduliensis]|uniref:DUF4158 domain-containing protein n=1 Tax=Nocardia barduliensis TaxID=2736643 RepID=UPI0034D9819C
MSSSTLTATRGSRIGRALRAVDVAAVRPARTSTARGIQSVDEVDRVGLGQPAVRPVTRDRLVTEASRPRAGASVPLRSNNRGDRRFGPEARNLNAPLAPERCRLGVAVQLATVRFLSMLLPDPLDVPAAVVDYLTEKLGIGDPSCVKAYLADPVRPSGRDPPRTRADRVRRYR